MIWPLYLDLETADADQLHTYGPGFVRLAAYAIGDSAVMVTTDFSHLVRLIEQAPLVVGHNILGFDLPALERHHDLDLGRLVREGRVTDTLLAARQNDPPKAGSKRSGCAPDGRRYDLDSLDRRFGGGGKLALAGDTALKRLAAEFGGYDKIPTDEPRYRTYISEDVEAVRRVAKHLVVDSYLWREHQVMWRLGHITSNGFRVDADLARRWVAEQDVRIEAGKQRLHERYGLPLIGAKPQSTAAGKAALEVAFIDCGVEPPRTPKGGLATGKDALDELVKAHPDNSELLELCAVLRAMNGERSTAGTVLEHTGPDGRVHPGVDARQSTGRISVTHPGLTVMGKRERANLLERALLLPEDGELLLCADLSQVDARAMAAHAQDPAYIDAFQAGRDYHSVMAAALFGTDGWDGTGHHPRRGDAKAITHATSYGLGARGLADDVGCTLEVAQVHLAKLAAQFPLLEAFKATARYQARAQIITNAFGRRMRITPGAEYTQGPAMIGQGTARDIMMEGLLRLPEWLLPCLRAVVHDELVFSVPEGRTDEARTEVLAALQFMMTVPGGTIPVPIYAECSDLGRDWADCYRSEKKSWPEVARAHRELPHCDDNGCCWHRTQSPFPR